jgi:hypothetical protein
MIINKNNLNKNFIYVNPTPNFRITDIFIDIGLKNLASTFDYGK